MWNRRVDRITLVGAAALCALSPGLTHGDSLEEIVVTAQRRTELSRDVPISITSISPDLLEQGAVETLSDISKLTPALRFDGAGTFIQPTIRGVGTAVSTSGGGPNVGIYVDGFFSANPAVSDFQLMKVQGIQVLKGPQGTLFGRNTTGGAILVTTADPSRDPSAELKVSYGRFDALGAQAYGTMALGERAAVDLEGTFSRGDGFTKNILTGDDDAGRYRNWSVRTGALVELSDTVDLLVRYTHSDTDDPVWLLANAYLDKRGNSGFLSRLPASAYGTNDTTGKALVYYPLPAGAFATDPDEIASPRPLAFTNKSDAVQARVRADLGFADLTSYTQYRKDTSLNHQDLDATAAPLFFIRFDVVDTTVSQELLLTSKPESRLQWTAGLNYFQIRDTWDVDASIGDAPYAEFGGSSTLTKSYAGFLDATYEVTPSFFVTVGGRYSHDVVEDGYFRTNFALAAYEDADGNFVPLMDALGNYLIPPETKIRADDLKNDRFTPRVVLRYKPSDASSIYGSFTRGYKAGILNVGGNSLVPVKPESIDAFEVGYKYDDRRIALDLSAYYYDYKNLQVSSFQSGAAQIRNAAQSRIWGAEGALRIRPTAAFDLNIAAAYTHARYRSFKNAPYYTYCDPAVPALSGAPFDCGALGPGALAQVTTDASDYRMQRAPSFTGNATASYTAPLAGGELVSSANVYYTSKFYFDPSQQFEQRGYALVSLRMEWTDPSRRYSFALFGDNVTGKRYRTQVLFNTLGIGNVWSAPATFGLSARVRL